MLTQQRQLRVFGKVEGIEAFQTRRDCLPRDAEKSARCTCIDQ